MVGEEAPVVLDAVDAVAATTAKKVGGALAVASPTQVAEVALTLFDDLAKRALSVSHVTKTARPHVKTVLFIGSANALLVVIHQWL